jgi:cobalt-zinc-cadmium efflux system outer membrane protein
LTSVAPVSAAPVTEAEAVRVFLEQSPQARRVPTIEQSVDAAFRMDARVSNPQIAYQVEDAAEVRDEFLTFQQELPITGRRGLLGERASVAASAARLDAENDVRDDVYALQRAFYEVLYRQRVVEALRDGDELLAGTVEILERREAEGEGSGYDVLRSQQELAELRIAIAEAEATLVASRARFGSFFDAESGMRSASLQGALGASSPVPDVLQATDDALAQRLDLKSLSAQRQSLDLEARAARRTRFPEPVLMAGWKRVEALGMSDTGYVAALTVPLPIFKRGSLAAAAANAEGQRVELDREILTRRIRAEVEAALARELAARAAAERYGRDVERRADELTRIARLKYDEGESGVLELLDAHRTLLTMRLRSLDVRYEAKAAEIDRNRVIGNEVKP